MARIDRMIDKAVDAASLSVGVRRATVGAILTRGSRILAVAANSYRNTPGSTSREHLSWHAEVAVIKMVRDTVGAQLYVARVLRTGEISMSRPCETCITEIKLAGISRVFYTSWYGDTAEDRRVR